MSIHELQAALRAVKEKREALRAAVEAGSGMVAASTLLHDAQHALEAAARRVAEGAGEPVAPSADALVEALRMIVEADDNHNLKGKDIDRARAALAKHKENTDGR